MKKIIKSILLVSCFCGVLFTIAGCGSKEDTSEHTHSIVSYEAKAPNCTEDGHKAYEECTACDYTTYEKIEKSGHSLHHYEFIDSDCNEIGVIENWYCNVCYTYFSDEEGTYIVNVEDLVITQKEHTDENSDLLCDYGCGKVLVAKEDLYQIINNTMSSKKVTVNEWRVASAVKTTYYFNENILYKNVDDGEQENYYYTEEGVTYILSKNNDWSKDVFAEEVDYNFSSLFMGKFNFTISSEFSIYNCNYGVFEGKTMFSYTNLDGLLIDIKFNDDYTLLDGIYFHDENNNIIYMFEMIHGENESMFNSVEDINNYLEGHKYAETTNTYYVYSQKGMLDAVNGAQTSGTATNPATIILMRDIAIEAQNYSFSNLRSAILIERGNIIIDLNGKQLSATNDPLALIEIGLEWGELCDAVLTIEDNSIEKDGKILATFMGINNQGGTVIFNSGTIEANNTKEEWVTIGINQYLGSITMNGGSIIVNNISNGWLSAGIGEDGGGGTVTINDGYIKVNAPIADALYLRSVTYINGGTIECNHYHMVVSLQELEVHFGVNEDGVGVTFVGGIKCLISLNLLLPEGFGYYDADGNLIEIADDVTEILDKGDVTVKRIN